MVFDGGVGVMGWMKLEVGGMCVREGDGRIRKGRQTPPFLTSGFSIDHVRTT